jgi:hypothetical protein
MTDDRLKALAPQAPTSLPPLSRLAERTLAEREERALVAARTLVVGPGGYAMITGAAELAPDEPEPVFRFVDLFAGIAGTRMVSNAPAGSALHPS